MCCFMSDSDHHLFASFSDVNDEGELHENMVTDSDNADFTSVLKEYLTDPEVVALHTIQTLKMWFSCCRITQCNSVSS